MRQKNKAFYNLVIVHYFAVPFALLGIALIFKKGVLTGQVTGRVTEATPVDGHKCKILVTYRLADEENDRTTEQTVFQTIVNGQEVNLYYDPKNPTSTIQTESDDSRLIGSILLGIACILVLLNWINLVLVRKYKSYAIFQGYLMGHTGW